MFQILRNPEIFVDVFVVQTGHCIAIALPFDHFQ